MTNLQRKTVLLTGAGGGFGRNFTRQLLDRNCALILTDLDIAGISEKTVNGSILGRINGDLSTPVGAEHVWDEAVKIAAEHNRVINVLINNAGIAVMGRHDEVPTGAWERLMQVNLLAPMRLSALAASGMIERRSGVILNVCSLASWAASDGLSAYAAAKFGLRGFSETLAGELAPHNVQISAVYPWFSDTPILDSPGYGTIALDNTRTKENLPNITDPADIVRTTLRAVEKGQRHIFPDNTSRIVQRLKRFTPGLFEIARRRLDRSVR